MSIKIERNSTVQIGAIHVSSHLRQPSESLHARSPNEFADPTEMMATSGFTESKNS